MPFKKNIGYFCGVENQLNVDYDMFLLLKLILL